MTDADRALIAHLLRRTGFAPRPAEVDAAARAGYAATVAAVTDGAATDTGAAATPVPALPRPSRRTTDPAAKKAQQAQFRGQATALTTWWLDRMTATSQPAREHLTWFWHTHYATSIQKVKVAADMAAQNQTFRTAGLRAFDALTLQVLQGPAMLRWLDVPTNKAAHPNENLARETMELFTLGVGNYTETDVREAARCLTGWGLDRSTGGFAEHLANHDAGSKSVLGNTGAFDGTDFVHLATRRPQTARWVATRLWVRHVAPVSRGDKGVDALADSAARTPDGAVVVADLYRRLLISPAFTGPEVRGGLVAQPVEYVVGAMRQLGVRAQDHAMLARETLGALGQVPFLPPSVGGWPSGRAWLTTSSALARSRFAQQLAKVADVAAITDSPAADRVDAAAHLLAVESFGSTTRSALDSARSDPERLVALALCSPEYVTR